MSYCDENGCINSKRNFAGEPIEMRNKQSSSIDWIFDWIEDVDLTLELWERIKQKAKAMHKEEMIGFALDCQEMFKDQIIEQYNKTYGGNK
jgi:hypothetical protein